jgi:hypothetical protein
LAGRCITTKGNPQTGAPASEIRSETGLLLPVAACGVNRIIPIKLDELPETATYQAALDNWTDQLKLVFPEGGRYWGVARKCLNIFMRDASYNAHLCEKYPRLKHLEQVLEVPLDSYTAKGLLAEDGATANGLKRWESIIGLTPDENRKFQQWAHIVAARQNISRVHLDLLYFPFP